MKLWKRNNLEKANTEIQEIEDAGHKVQMFTDWHWNIDGIDVWPTSKKYMRNGVVKVYEKLSDIF